MSLIVQKYGGTSVADVERIRNVARRVTTGRQRGNDLVVVVSAMAGETNRLLGLARDMCPEPDRRESDVLVSTGEQVTTALLAMALTHDGLSGRLAPRPSDPHRRPTAPTARPASVASTTRASAPS